MSTESPPAGAQKTDGAPEHAESASAPSLAAGAETMGANEKYSSSSAQEWLLVGAQTKSGAPEHAESAAAPSPAAAAETMGANDQRGSASAEQWKLVQHVLLTPEELPELRRRGQRQSRSLHDEARTWTNKLANVASEHVGVQANLVDEWKNWKLYIATRNKAEELVGPGVVAFTAENIEGTHDPNRAGRPRLDLVLHHSDGGYVRLHPGSQPKNDAIHRYFPRQVSAPEHARRPASASEHAAHEWRTAGASSSTFTSERAALVPQGDRLNKNLVWKTVEQLLDEKSIPDEQSGSKMDLTDGQVLRWWLWICNLGNLTREVIGAGVVKAHLAMNGSDEAVFTFTRADDTECTVRLYCHRRGKGRDLEVYM